jgi:hypothetical protein
MLFIGQYDPRSSATGTRQPNQPPGESEIQQLNPGRRARIVAATGWSNLVPGSLNLRVERSVVEELASRQPLIEEPGSEIVYPAPHQRIPILREAYWYYAAVASKVETQEPVLVRRAKVPLWTVVELFAACALTARLALRPGDPVSVQVLAPPRTVE